MSWTYSEKYASIVPRTLAFLIDGALFGLLLPFCVWFLSMAPSVNDSIARFAEFVVLVYIPSVFLFIFYQAYCLSHYGQTVGRAVVGIQVTDAQGKLLSARMALFRELIAKPVSFVLAGAGIFAMVVNHDQRAWHDLLADTYVHKKRSQISVGIVVLIMLYAAMIGILFMASRSFMENTSLRTELGQSFKDFH